MQGTLAALVMPSFKFPLACVALSSLVLACAGGQVDDTFGTADETMSTSSTMGDGDGDGDGDGGDGDGDGDGDTSPGDGDGEACTTSGCDCDGSAGSCDDGLSCIDGTCQSPSCTINGIVDPGEQCDDNNEFEGDGCDTDCSFTLIRSVTAGANHTCAVLEGDRLRCWGLNNIGQLGYGNLDNIGDNEHPSIAGDVVLGGTVEYVNAGGNHTCAFMVDGTVRCWGSGGSGQLGQATLDNIGDNDFPFSVNPISLNSDVLSIQAGANHTCVMVASQGVRCWGVNNVGQLGYGNVNNLSIPLTIDLPLNGAVTKLAVGRSGPTLLTFNEHTHLDGELLTHR
jgi:cysteine-rich repeat protein